MKPRVPALFLAALVLTASRPARAERTDIGAAMFAYLYVLPISIVLPSVFGVDASFVDARSGPRFLLGWAWQLPLERGAHDFRYVRHRLPLEVTIGLGENADRAADGMKSLAGVDARAGYRYVTPLGERDRGFGGLFGGGTVLQAAPYVTGGVYPEIGVRYRPHTVYPLVLALIARCDVRFAGADLIRPSVVLSIAVY